MKNLPEQYFDLSNSTSTEIVVATHKSHAVKINIEAMHSLINEPQPQLVVGIEDAQSRISLCLPSRQAQQLVQLLMQAKIAQEIWDTETNSLKHKLRAQPFLDLKTLDEIGAQ